MSTPTATSANPYASGRAPEGMRTVRDATFDAFRSLGLTTIYSNPGSTEIAFLTDFPDDIEFVLGLHEGAVVGMAAGEAIGAGAPRLVLLHTTAGLGNAISAIATARASRAPLVILVGQQDRRHLALEPFLAGRLEGLGGEYPVSVEMPVRPQDVPGAVRRAHVSASIGRGPALVVVPQGDWAEPAPEPYETGGPERLVIARAADDDAVDELAAFLDGASAPALVVGAAVATDAGWAGTIALAERLRAPVFQETFGPRAGFPWTHPLFAGHLPADRPRLREVLAPFDAVLAVGAPVFRQYPFSEGPLAPGDTRLAMVSDDAAEVRRSPVDVAVLGDPGAIASALAARLDQRDGEL
ncbi:MAG TPA: thiamine pyrophosphate-binding protein, partial [Solirubrobacteraceae bacterium]|nr:thiamine pyrophosphate-binding protein [Solirubrobacteraceae bacterium]